MLTGTLGSKTEFVQSLDIRLCNGLEQAARQLKGQVKPDRFYEGRVKKLDHIFKKQDTQVMRGIHLSSLVTWYDYVVAHKTIKLSDMADIYHSIIYPYCAIVIADASRVDVIQRIQREDRLYLNMKCFRFKDFLKELAVNQLDHN